MLHVLIADELLSRRHELHDRVERLAERCGTECAIAHTDDGLKTFRKAKRLQPDLVVISSTLPHSGGLQVMFAIQHYAPNARLIVLAESATASLSDADYARAGVHGVVRKHQDNHVFMECMRTVLRGEKYFSSEAAGGTRIN